jgi:dephospho-CoA kinase
MVGGVCSGKSSVADHFGRLGCAVINADRIAHDILDLEDIKIRLSEEFGPAVMNDAGDVDRKKVGDIVFTDPDRLRRLNSIIHPPVLARCQCEIDQYMADPAVAGIVLDAPLLMETGLDGQCDVLVFVDCSEENRRQRALKKGLSYEKHIKIREKFQISLDKKREKAQYIVDNNSGESAAAEQVARIFTALNG